jgi:hypothetical protein
VTVNTAQQLAVIILSGGGAAAIFTLVRAFLAIRSSADTREAVAISNLERWRVEADNRADRAYAELEHARELSAYWQRRSAVMEHALVLNGGVCPPFPDPPAHPERSSP